MESELVKRLSERYAQAFEGSGRVWEYEDDARWWLNAIADELEADGAIVRSDPESFGRTLAARWLREQAGK